MYYSKHLLHESLVLLSQYFIYFAINYKSRKNFKTKAFKENAAFLGLLFLDQTSYMETLLCYTSIKPLLPDTHIVLWLKSAFHQKHTLFFPCRGFLNFKVSTNINIQNYGENVISLRLASVYIFNNRKFLYKSMKWVRSACKPNKIYGLCLETSVMWLNIWAHLLAQWCILNLGWLSGIQFEVLLFK